MTRRGFFGLLAAAPAALALDPERALWIPRKKLISIPAPIPKVQMWSVSMDLWRGLPTAGDFAFARYMDGKRGHGGVDRESYEERYLRPAMAELTRMVGRPLDPRRLRHTVYHPSALCSRVQIDYVPAGVPIWPQRESLASQLLCKGTAPTHGEYPGWKIAAAISSAVQTLFERVNTKLENLGD